MSAAPRWQLVLALNAAGLSREATTLRRATDARSVVAVTVAVTGDDRLSAAAEALLWRVHGEACATLRGVRS